MVYYDNVVKKHKKEFLLRKEILSFIAKYHDLGKNTFHFQKILKDKKYKSIVNHSYLTILIFEYIIKNKEYNEESYLLFIKNRVKKTAYISEEIRKNTPNIYNLLYIMGTHHRLPEISNIGSIPVNTSFVYLHNLTDDKIKDFRIISKEIFDKAKNDLKKIANISIPINEIIDLRNSLILADHIGSTVKFNNNHKNYKKDLSAKDLNNNYQKYSEHIAAVNSKINFAEEIFFQNKNPFSKWSETNLDSIIHETTEIDKFKWQEKSIQFAKDNINKDIPTLTFLSSSTGSGKTRFGLKYSSLINKKNRLTVIQGLRTLTLQTGTAYTNLKIFKEEDINVLIGSKSITDIYQTYNKEEKVDEPELSIDRQSNFKDKDYFSRNVANFLDTPILISTIDYMIKATDYRRSNHINPTIRLITSDLIIDEVDELGLEDQKSVLNLIFLAGYYGVNLILSTATPYPALAKAYYEAFMNGIKAKNTYKEINCLYISDFTNKRLNIMDFEISWKEATSIVIKNTVSKNNTKIKDLKKTDILQCALELHENNNEVDSKGNKFSAGLIRIAHVKEIFSLIKIIEPELHNHNIKIIVYHAQFTLLERSYIEKQLDILLERKKDKLYEKEFMKDNIQKNNIVIVIASPVEEVGRDHDFDWHITEPSSTRSIIQSSGRVYRHRYRENNTNTNIVILNKNFNLQQGRITKIYSQPGFEEGNEFVGHTGLHDLSDLVKEEEFLSTNKHIFEQDENKNLLAVHENLAIEKKLNFSDTYIKDFEGLSFFNRFLVYNTRESNFGFYTDFRQNEGTQQFYIDNNNDIMHIEPKIKSGKNKEHAFQYETVYNESPIIGMNIENVNREIFKGFNTWKNKFLKKENGYKRFNTFSININKEKEYMLKIEFTNIGFKLTKEKK